MIDTPEGIAFARAAARKGALANEIAFTKIFDKPARRSGGGQTAYSIVKQVYGFHGSRESVLQELDNYVEGVLYTRQWAPEYAEKIVSIVNEATEMALEENPNITTKDPIDANIQAFFESGAITEQEGNDACLLLWIEVVRKYAGNH